MRCIASCLIMRGSHNLVTPTRRRAFIIIKPKYPVDRFTEIAIHLIHTVAAERVEYLAACLYPFPNAFFIIPQEHLWQQPEFEIVLVHHRFAATTLLFTFFGEMQLKQGFAYHTPAKSSIPSVKKGEEIFKKIVRDELTSGSPLCALLLWRGRIVLHRRPACIPRKKGHEKRVAHCLHLLPSAQRLDRAHDPLLTSHKLKQEHALLLCQDIYAVDNQRLFPARIS